MYFAQSFALVGPDYVFGCDKESGTVLNKLNKINNNK